MANDVLEMDNLTTGHTEQPVFQIEEPSPQIEDEVSVTPPTAPDAKPTLIDLVQFIRQGIPYTVFEELCSRLNLSQKVVASHLGLNIRTLTRRKKTQFLNPDEGERIVRAYRIVEVAVETLEDDEAAIRWITTPKIALGKVAPISLLDTAFGTKEVENLLDRLEAGELI